MVVALLLLSIGFGQLMLSVCSSVDFCWQDSRCRTHHYHQNNYYKCHLSVMCKPSRTAGRTFSTSVYAGLHFTQILKEGASRFRKRGGRGDADVEVETERGMQHSLRRRPKIVAALKLPESVETEIEERGVSIQKARRKRRHDYRVYHS